MNEYTEGLLDRSRDLVFRCLTAVNRQQELPMGLCMSYLMGWGDVYRSHHYVPLHWTSFHNLLTKTYTDLSPR